MDEPRLRCTVAVPDGPSRRVGANGILIGRQPDCDIVATDPSVSRRHALVRLTSDGAEVVPLGRAAIDVNGTEHTSSVALADGDVLRLPGLELRVAVSLPRPMTTAAWVLEREGGGTFGIARTPFTLGGDDADDLIIEGWPPHALRFHLAQGELFIEVCDGTETLDPLAVGERVTHRGETFVIAHAAGRVATTAVSGASQLPTRVVIEMLPRGGRVVITVGGRDHAVFLADRRLDLVVALLRPPAGYRAGELIPDDVVRAIVWPRKPSVSRPEINTLISRCRRDLLDVGLAGPRLLERAPGGGATRFVLAADADVDVKS